MHEMSNLFPGENKKNSSTCLLLKILPRVLCVNKPVFESITVYIFPR